MSTSRTLWYVAAKTQELGRAARAALQAADERVHARWLDAKNFGPMFKKTDLDRQKAAVECMADCRVATACVVMSNDVGELGKGGKHWEAGFIYAMGGPVHVVGWKENVFHWLPDVVVHDTLEDFIRHIRRHPL